MGDSDGSEDGISKKDRTLHSDLITNLSDVSNCSFACGHFEFDFDCSKPNNRNSATNITNFSSGD